MINFPCLYNFYSKAILDKNEFGFDLPTNERLLEENDQLHKEIHQFQSEVDKTCSLQVFCSFFLLFLSFFNSFSFVFVIL